MLYPFSMFFIIANVLLLLLSPIRSCSKWMRWGIASLALMALLQLVIDGFYQTLILAYLFTAILIVVGFYHWKRTPVKSRFRFVWAGWAVLWRLICIFCLAISLILTGSFGKSDTFLASLFLRNQADYSHFGWSDAFDKMNDHLANNYAFGEWKSIKWDSLHHEYAKQIVAAERVADTNAYYLALRRYVFSIPDGHVSLKGNDWGQQAEALSGGFGFAAIQLDDGRVIVHILQENSPAAEGGIQWGAELLTWNDEPILSAVERVPLIWAGSPSATREAIRINQWSLLTRAPIGTSVAVTFRNPQDTSPRNISLTAMDDSLATYREALMMGMPAPSLDLSSPPVEWQILPNGYGFLKMFLEMPTLGDLHPVGTVRKAVKAFNEANVPGVVIDLRLNGGGIDEMAPMMMAHFVTDPLFYEQVALKDKKTGELKVAGKLALEPARPCYSGPLAMLISQNTCSTGEGFPMIMQALQRGPVVGFYGTSASFGMAGSSIALPGGYVVEYPNGASLDKGGKIQLDSDHSLQGGVLPNVRIPINLETLKAIFMDGRDRVLEEAIAEIKKDLEKSQANEFS